MDVALRDPLAIISRLQATTTKHEGLIDDIVEKFAHVENVPCINAKSAAWLTSHVGKLVRFRGMIQDSTLGNEVFASYSVAPNGDKLCNLFSEGHHQDAEPAMDSLTERTLYVCVDIPGEAKWARDSWSDPTDDLASLSTCDNAELAPTLLEKVPSKTGHSQVILLKVYTNDDALQSSAMFDFTGILDSTHLPISEFSEESAETKPSQIYSLHCLSYKPVDVTVKLPQPPALEDWNAHRQKLVEYLSQAVNGDLIAAEFILLALLARIHTRKGGLTIGNCSVDLSFPRSSQPTNNLSTILEPLVPYLCTLPINISALNDSKAYQPSSTGSDNLKAGQLQLVKSTFVVADEFEMKEGQLQDKGIKNLKALGRVVAEQKLAYVFPYSEFDFETDIGVIVLSEGRSLLPSTCIVPVLGTRSNSSDMASPTDLSCWRSMIANARRKEFTINEDITSHIEQDVVALRQANAGAPDAVGPDELMLRMTIARTLALSHGHSQLTSAIYKQACALDDERRKRLKLQ